MSTSASLLVAPIVLPAGPKVALYTLAAHSCQFCGLTWLGNKRLREETGLGESALLHALKALVNDGWVAIHAFPRGGRGRATEYIVLPGVPRGDTELSPAPCGKCQENQKNTVPRTEFDNGGTEKHRATHGVSGKLRGLGGQNPVDGHAPTISNTSTISARARERQADPPASPSGAAAPRSSDPPTPADIAQARQAVREITDRITSAIGVDRSPQGQGRKP